jgi:hypothetical protein
MLISPASGGEQEAAPRAPTKNPESVSAAQSSTGDERLVAGGCGLLDGVLDLLEGADLDLADALAADVEFAGEILQRDRIVAQAAGLEDALFALVEHADGS